MNRAIQQVISGDLILDLIAGFRAQAEGLIAQANLLEVAALADRKSRQFERENMIDAARAVASADDMSTKQAARYLGSSPSALQHGKAGYECLNRKRFLKGRLWYYSTARVYRHRENTVAGKTCDCGEINIDAMDGPKLVKGLK